jgi:predicted secreted protein
MIQQTQDDAENVTQHLASAPQQRVQANMFVRCVIYSHVLAVVICGLFSYMDRSGGLNKLPEVVVAIPFLPALLAIFVCPPLILGAIMSGRLRGRDAAMVFVVETIVECAQFFALLPAVQ